MHVNFAQIDTHGIFRLIISHLREERKCKMGVLSFARDENEKMPHLVEEPTNFAYAAKGHFPFPFAP